MTPADPSSPKRFEERLRAARESQRPRTRSGPGAAPSSALGVGLRLGIELVSAVVVGVGIGWLLDRWLGTQPWLLILFFMLGAGAGMLNVVRAADRLKIGKGSNGGGGSGDRPGGR